MGALGLLLGAASLTAAPTTSAEEVKPLRLAIVGLTHGHVYRFVSASLARKDVELVGLVEARPDAIDLSVERLKIDRSFVHTSLEALIRKAGPVEAVAVFSSTFEHQAIVEDCAARGIHVMVEKPLAVNGEQARAIASAAKRGRIQVIVNYESSWTPANREMYRLVKEAGAIGQIRKLVAHDGNDGPVAIRSPAPFRSWLLDLNLNGGGALMDMGCYGAGLMTWFMDGRRPLSVVASTQNLKPADYPKVEDEATIVLTYPDVRGVIQASWNWLYPRKELEVHGSSGYVLALKRNELRVRFGREKEERAVVSPPSPVPFTDALGYFVAVARGHVLPSGPASLKVNMVVMEILDAARESVWTGRRVDLQ